MYSISTTLLSIITLTCSAGANNAIPHTTFRRIAFVPRGGSSDDAIDGKIDSIISSDRQELIGVIDLRPKPDSDSIILLQSNKSEDGADSTFDIVQEALFSPAKHDEISADDAEMDQQAASSNSIGSLCSTAYLIIAYDFENGKTVLHRSFGGTKLMTFVDGVRSRMSQTNPGQEGAVTKLIILLVPSSSSSATTLLSKLPSSTAPKDALLSNTSNPLLNKIVLDLTNSNAVWDASGASFLVNRLSETFALGGEEYQNMEPFAVELVGVFDVGQAKEESDSESDGDIREVIVRHIVCSLRDNASDKKGGDTVIKTKSAETASAANFQDLIRHSYEASGGVDNVDFQ